MTTKPIAIEARNLTKSYGEKAVLGGVDISVPEGTIFSLLGPNGAGKTTTVNILTTLIPASGGDAFIHGNHVAGDADAVRKSIGVTGQFAAVDGLLTGRENLQLMGRLHHLGKAETKRRTEDLLERFDLVDAAKRAPATYSGGMKRRLDIAMCLMGDPKVIFLDEPTTGLDPAVRLALWTRVRDLRAAGTTVLLTTHYMDEAQRLCDRVAIVANGRIIVEGRPDALIRTHLAPEVVEVDCAPDEEAALLDGTVPPRHGLRVGRRVMLYVDDASPLVERMHQRDPSNQRALVVRPTNLEDVYLRLTGTSLEAA